MVNLTKNAIEAGARNIDLRLNYDDTRTLLLVSTDTSRTLESIIGEVVQQTVAAHGGNRAAAARQLGISRTTLWRYLGKLENGENPEA